MSVTVKFDPASQTPQAQIIGDATPGQDGVMTALQAAQLAALVAGTVTIKVYTNLTRPLPAATAAVPGVTAVMIFNIDDLAPNFTDGLDWYDAMGNLT